MTTKITIHHVEPSRGVLSAWVDTGHTPHRIGHLPHQGWFCTCARVRRCPYIDRVKELVPVAAIELGARHVERGHVRAPEYVLEVAE